MLLMGVVEEVRLVIKTHVLIREWVLEGATKQNGGCFGKGIRC